MATEKCLYVICYSYPEPLDGFTYEDPITHPHETDALNARDQLFFSDQAVEAVWVDKLSRKQVGKRLTRSVPASQSQTSTEDHSPLPPQE